MHDMYRFARMREVGIAVALVSALALPLFSFAQPSSDEDARLRAEIRSALLSDPRSQNLSEAEVDGLVGALAEQAKEQGLVNDYIPPEPTFATWYGQEAVGYTFFGYSVSEAALYIIILFALGLAIMLLRRILTMHHEVSPPAAPTPSTTVPPVPPSEPSQPSVPPTPPPTA